MTEHPEQPQPAPAMAAQAPVSEPEPVPVSEPEPVSEVAAVAAALDRLRAIDGTPVGEHVEAFDEVHRLLQDALATLDEA